MSIFQRLANLPLLKQPFKPLGHGHLNPHNGILDLVASYLDTGVVGIHLGNGSDGKGDGTFQDRTEYWAGDWARGIAMDDFNGDGVIDLAISNEVGDDLSVLLGLGECL